MHFDFTLTWSSLAAIGGAIGAVWQIARAARAVVGLLTFCKSLVTQHEQMWRAHCKTYDLDYESGLPINEMDEG